MNWNGILTVVFIIMLHLYQRSSRIYLVVRVTVDRLGDAKDQVKKIF
jgi:hypothetical protein